MAIRLAEVGVVLISIDGRVRCVWTAVACSDTGGLGDAVAFLAALLKSCRIAAGLGGSSAVIGSCLISMGRCPWVCS
jgi:hypothetical protein